MRRIYVYENGTTVPLCVIIKGRYVDYITGEIISNENALDFIKKSLNNGTMKEKMLDLVVYKVVENNTKTIVGYNYQIDEYNNFLNINKRLLSEAERKFLVNKLMSGIYIQEVMWE